MSKKRLHKSNYNKRKIRFVNYDDPKVQRQLNRKIYQDYLRNIYTNYKGGDDSEQ